MKVDVYFENISWKGKCFPCSIIPAIEDVKCLPSGEHFSK